jgi:hypothetical protein
LDRPLSTRAKSGRPKVTTQEQDNAIVEMTREMPFTNTTQIKEELQLNCSANTIARRLHASELHARTPAKKIELTEAHAAARLAFCHANLERDWSQVIFTDEKVFSTSDETPLLKVWRPNNSRYLPEYVRTTRASGRHSLGYWGWMHRAGPGEVVQVTPPRFNSRRYIEILEEVLLPSVRTIYPEEEMEQIVLVQDNCSIHTARIVQDWFEDHPELVVLIWPSKSPDLNPIENLWGQMVFSWDNPPERVRLRTVAELDENVTRVWENMRGRDYCQNMVDGMRQRLQECIDNRGYYTHY